MFDAAKKLLQAAALPEFKATFTVLEATVVASGLDKGSLDWSAPSTVATVKGALQQASKEALLRHGITGERQPLQLFCEPTELHPKVYRVSDGVSTYQVIAARTFALSHSEALVEEVA